MVQSASNVTKDAIESSKRQFQHKSSTALDHQNIRFDL